MSFELRVRICEFSKCCENNTPSCVDSEYVYIYLEHPLSSDECWSFSRYYSGILAMIVGARMLVVHTK